MSPRPLAHALAILNPAAGRGVAPAVWARVAPELRAAGVDVDVVRTEAPGHATELAIAAARGGRSAVLAVGGDGTIHEVANGLLRATRGGDATRPLGIIPAGSGNDFIKWLKIPSDPTDAARALVNVTPRAVDVGQVGDRYFVNGVGIGFDARIAIEARAVRHLRGTARYGWALARALRSYRPWRCQILLNDVEVANRPVTMITAANGPCCGGGFWLCPDACLDDGKLDVLLADAHSRPGVLGFLLRSLRAAHVGRPGIHIHRARTLRVTSDMPLPVHADGEILHEATHRVAIATVPGRLTVLA